MGFLLGTVNFASWEKKQIQGHFGYEIHGPIGMFSLNTSGFLERLHLFRKQNERNQCCSALNFVGEID